MHGADNAPRGVEQNVEIDHRKGNALVHNPEQYEDVSHHDRREQFEEIFNPEVDYPESPEIRRREMRGGMRQQSHCIERRNRKRRKKEQPWQIAEMFGI